MVASRAGARGRVRPCSLSVSTFAQHLLSFVDNRTKVSRGCCRYGFTLTDDTQLHAHHPTIKHEQTNQHSLFDRQVSAKRSTSQQ